MKKSIITLVTLIVAMGVNVKAQSVIPEKGNFGVEIGLNPFTENGGFNLLDNGIKLRYFISNHDALRLGLGFNLASVEGRTATSLNSGHSHYSLNLGYERYWGVSDRTGLYFGAQAGYTRLFAFYDDFADDRHMTTDNNGHVSGHYYMGGVFTGFDVYLWKGLYCGAEVGLKAERMKESQSSYTTASSAHTYVNAGFYCEPAIRVGWTF